MRVPPYIPRGGDAYVSDGWRACDRMVARAAKPVLPGTKK